MSVHLLVGLSVSLSVWVVLVVVSTSDKPLPAALCRLLHSMNQTSFVYHCTLFLSVINTQFCSAFRHGALLNELLLSKLCDVVQRAVTAVVNNYTVGQRQNDL